MPELYSVSKSLIDIVTKNMSFAQFVDVMTESIQAAMTVVRSRVNILGVDEDFQVVLQ